MEAKAEEKNPATPALTDLARGAKGLRHADAPHENAQEKVSEEELEPYRRLFEKHRGDIRSIFDDLGENPGKALKYPPKDSEKFAAVYVRGGYTYIPDAKSSRK